MIGDPWDNRQDFMLAKAVRENLPTSLIARHYGRSNGAMRSRSEHLCLVGRGSFYDWRAENRVLARWYQRCNPERYVLPKMRRDGVDITKPRIRIK